MQLQVFSLIKEKRATFHCQVSSVHIYPSMMGISVLHLISTVHQWTFQEMVLPDIITEVPEIPVDQYGTVELLSSTHAG